MENKEFSVVLAGQANVGKSVIFNHLTGLHQHIGNWPGKTIEKAEGLLTYKGYRFHILDLPGIYSLTTYSLEELVSREYIAVKKPDFVINVIDATNLERNLIFTLQLIELKRPVVLALNMMDLVKRKGLEINVRELSRLLQIPVVPTIASQRKGLTRILDRGIELVEKKVKTSVLRYGKKTETEIKKIVERLRGVDTFYPKRWVAIKFLEKDKEIEKLLKERAFSSWEELKGWRSQLEKFYDRDSSLVISAERCNIVSQVVKKVVEISELKKTDWRERLDYISSHKIWGYFLMVLILASMFVVVFNFGNLLSSGFEEIFSAWEEGFRDIFGYSYSASVGWSALESILALINIALPYILPFYFTLFLLEDSGYLARLSFLLDNLMHKIGIHGKSCIPLMLGFGCNVPACLACRIMETERERFITGFLSTLIPCSAVTVIIMGLVGKFMGLGWALALYLFSFLVILAMGELISRILPGETTELIMEMPEFKIPNLKTVFLQSWFRLKEFIFLASPLVVISGVLIEGARLKGYLSFLADFLSPLTTQWLGLPEVCGILLIFGVLRKELILVMLATLLGTSNFSQVLSPVQMITLAVVSMFYVPCIATIVALIKEFGWKRAIGITLFEILFALGIGGLILRLLGQFVL